MTENQESMKEALAAVGELAMGIIPQTELTLTADESGGRDIRILLRDLKTNIDRAYLEMGKQLYMVIKAKLYEAWGFATFGEYVYADLGYRERKARYLVSIWQKLVVELGISEERISQIEWSKAKEIVGVVNEENVEDWLAKAENQTALELMEEVRRVRTGEPEAKITRMTFTLLDDQADIVKEALTVVGELAGSDKPGHLLTCICADFLSGNRGKDTRLAQVIRAIQATYEVNLVLETENYTTTLPASRAPHGKMKIHFHPGGETEETLRKAVRESTPKSETETPNDE